MATKDPKSFTKIYLNGEYVRTKSGKTFSLNNPKDGSVVVDAVPVAGTEDIDLAVRYAQEAFEGPWSKFTSLQRTECFHRLAAIMEEELIPILTLDSLTGGNPVSLIPTREKTYIKNCILYFSGWCDKQKGDFLPADDGFAKIVTHEPLGVCAAINPFNAPVATMILKVAPALATGNVVVSRVHQRESYSSSMPTYTDR